MLPALKGHPDRLDRPPHIARESSVSKSGEFELIAEYFSRPVQGGDDNVLLGVGDDAAVLGGLDGQQLVVSVDSLIEGVHFPENAPAELVARRALRVNLSDMAAMGATPRWFTLALTLPEADEGWLEAFSRGLYGDAESYGCRLIGGDTTAGPLNIGIQMLGIVPSGQSVLTRSGARPGDLLVVTGQLGDAGAAMTAEVCESVLPDAGSDEDRLRTHCLQRYWLPEPRVEFAHSGAAHIRATCDISDGLLADLGHICARSQVSARLDLERIPVSEDLLRQNADMRRRALVAGDDYELCLAVDPAELAQLQELAQRLGIDLTVAGVFESAEAGRTAPRVVDGDGREVPMALAGYRHF